MRSQNLFRYSTIKQKEKLPSVSKLLTNLEQYGRIQLFNVNDVHQDIKLRYEISDDDAIMLIKCCGMKILNQSQFYVRNLHCFLF